MISASPLLRLLLPMAAGIALGECTYNRLAPQPDLTLGLWGVVVAAVIGALASGRKVRRTLRHVQNGLFIVAAFLLGVLLLWGERRGQAIVWPTHDNTAMPLAANYRARVCDIPKPTAKAWRARLLLMDGANRGQTIEAILVDRRRPLRLGDVVVGHFAVRALRPHRNPGQTERAPFLRRQGVTGTALCFARQWRVLSASTPLTLKERALLLRERWVAQYHAHFPAHDMAVLSAMTLGHRGLVDAETRALYSETGASHVLALSGLHLAILYALFEYTLGAWSRRRSLPCQVGVGLLGLGLIWAFAFLTGFPTSLVRAALMFSIVRLLLFFSRPPRPLHSLTLAVLVMLVVSPSWLFDVGFQLSCAAVAGILILRPLLPTLQWFSLRPTLPPYTPLPRFTRWKKSAVRFVYELLAVSLAAQAGTAPLVAYYFNLLPLNGIFSSLVVIPAAYLLLSGSLLFLLLPFARSLLAPFLSGVLGAMESGLRLLQALPGSVLTVHPTLFAVGLSYLFLLSCVAFAGSRTAALRRRFLFVSLGLLLVGGVHFAYISHRRARVAPEVRLYHTTGVTALHFIADARHSYLLATDTLRARRALAQTARRDWDAHNLNVAFLPLSALSTAEGCTALQQRCAPAGSRPNASPPLIDFSPRVVLFAHRRWAVVRELLPLFPPREPLAVDYLVLTRGARNHLPRLLRFYRPRLLLLAADLSDHYRLRYLEEAAALRLHVFDVDRQGAFLEEISAAPAPVSAPPK